MFAQSTVVCEATYEFIYLGNELIFVIQMVVLLDCCVVIHTVLCLDKCLISNQSCLIHVH